MSRPLAGAWVSALALSLCVAAPRAQLATGVLAGAPMSAANIDGLIDRAEALVVAREFAEAQPHLERALQAAQHSVFAPQTARANYWLSRVAVARRDRASSLGHAQRALDGYDALHDNQGIARAALQLIDLDALDIDRSRSLVERAAPAARAAGNTLLEGMLMHRFGDRLFNAGRYEESMQVLTRAAELFESVPAPSDLGRVYNSIGRVYRAHGRLDVALGFQKRALDLHRKGDDQFALMQSLNAVSSVYLRLNDTAVARPYLQEALAMADKGAEPRVQDVLRANMANLLAELGQLAAAAETLEQVLARGLDEFPAVRQGQLSAMYRGMGRRHDALAMAEKAVAGCGAGEATVCVFAYLGRSEAQIALGNSREALADLTTALARLEDLRRQLVPSDFFRQNFHQYYQNAYTATIALQMVDGAPRRALETAELARSRAFVDLLESRSVPSARATAPANAEDLFATAKRLDSTLVLYWVADDETFIWVVTPGGALHTRRIDVRRTRLRALVRETAPFTESDPPAVRPSEANRPGTAGSQPPSLRNASSAWRELHTLLIASISEVLPKAPGALLTIVPHDTLSGLSFAALQNRRGRHLLEDYTLHYASAGALFRFTAPMASPDEGGRALLLVSDPTLPRLSSLDTPLPRLPGARMEAAAIARLLSAAQVTSLQGAGATEARIRGAASTHTILHFATHAVIRDDDPFSSYLALGPSDGEGAADGLLTAQEVYGLRLHADLVLLSGCQSAGGIVTGDGIATFARAFLSAGATSFIASMWDVADEPTNRLVRGFYRAWLSGATKAAALRSAQLQLLADLRAGRVRVKTPVGEVSIPEHPVFWAGFVLSGEPR